MRRISRDEGQDQDRLRDDAAFPMCGTVRIASYSRSERNGNCRVGAPVGHAFDPFFSLLSSRLTFRLHFHPPSRLDHRRKANRERITFHPTLTASRFPLSFLFVFLFSLYFRQRRSILSRSSTALVRSGTFLYRFLFIFADIFFIFPSTIFVNIRHNDYMFTYPSLMLTLLLTDTITKV